MELKELASLYFFHNMEGIGNRTLWKIKQNFAGFRNCLTADSKDLAALLSPAISDRIIQARQEIDPVKSLQDLLATGTRIACVEDADYPSLLANIHDPPYLFYYLGELGILEGLCIAVVGSRRASHYGRSQARRFGQEMAQEGVVVVSGMARGIDTEAHLGALEAGGKTAAVLGSGLDIVYPPENGELLKKISEQGIVISEFPPHTHPEPGNFPVRNRLIAGLSRGVLVVEAQKRSGALITVDFALEQGRDVFALPGQVNSKNSEGTNNLIKQGACLVTDLNDILGEYKTVFTNAEIGELLQGDLFELDHEERIILTAMGYESVHFDELLYQSGFNIGALSTLLLQMELKGIIKSLPGNYYVKI